VKRTSEALETGAVAEEGIAESAADQVGGVGRDVAALVVTVKGKVETEEILEVLVLLAALAEHGSKVVRPILLEVNLTRKGSAALVRVLVDLGGDGRELGEQRNAVVKGRLPVVGLAEALLVGLGELGSVVEGRDSNGELGHGVKVLGEVVKHLVDIVGKLTLLGELARELADLVGGGDFAGEEKPEHGLGKHLSASLALGQLLLAVLDGAAMEANTLVGVEHGTLPDHSLQAAHATNSVLDLDLANNLGAMGLDLLEELALGGDNLLERRLQIRLSSSVRSPREATVDNGDGAGGLIATGQPNEQSLERHILTCARLEGKPKKNWRNQTEGFTYTQGAEGARASSQAHRHGDMLIIGYPNGRKREESKCKRPAYNNAN